jgi:hypothetical protein
MESDTRGVYPKQDWKTKVGRLALRDVFPDNQSQRDWCYLGIEVGRGIPTEPFD